jgi:hypothetical protein
MNRRLVVFLITCFTIMFLSSTAFSGVEPSPFKGDYAKKIAVIISNIEKLTEVTSGTPDDVRTRALGVIELLQQNQKLQYLNLIKKHAINVMLSVSSVSQASGGVRDENVTAKAVEILDRISAVAFNPQPEPPAVTLKGMALLDKISSRMFNPQPEPPGDVTLVQRLELLNRISIIAFNPQPEPPAKIMQVLSLLDRIASVAFNPQPEPPGDGMLTQMFDIIDLIASIRLQQR